MISDELGLTVASISNTSMMPHHEPTRTATSSDVCSRVQVSASGTFAHCGLLANALVIWVSLLLRCCVASLCGCETRRQIPSDARSLLLEEEGAVFVESDAHAARGRHLCDGHTHDGRAAPAKLTTRCSERRHRDAYSVSLGLGSLYRAPIPTQ